MDDAVESLPHIFHAAAQIMQAQREVLNKADPYNGDHGDHMLEIFQVAERAAHQVDEQDLPGAFRLASQELRKLEDNGSAQVYALGLAAFAVKFEDYGVTLEDLAAYVQRLLAEDGGSPGAPKSGDTLKALVAGLSTWQAAAGDKSESKFGLNDLFELGVIYMQAKGRNATKIGALADAAITASPLDRQPYRAQSGKLAIQALLSALQEI